MKLRHLYLPLVCSLMAMLLVTLTSCDAKATRQTKDLPSNSALSSPQLNSTTSIDPASDQAIEAVRASARKRIQKTFPLRYSDLTGQKFMDYCLSSSTADSRCDFYLTAVVDEMTELLREGYLQKDGCVPDVSIPQLRSVVLNYGTHYHPEFLKQNAALLISAALFSSYPCDGRKPTVDPSKIVASAKAPDSAVVVTTEPSPASTSGGVVILKWDKWPILNEWKPNVYFRNNSDREVTNVRVEVHAYRSDGVMLDLNNATVSSIPAHTTAVTHCCMNSVQGDVQITFGEVHFE